jgi:hypothetical protein
MDALGFELSIKLLHESLDRRTFEFQFELANGLREYLLELGSGFLKVAHWG